MVCISVLYPNLPGKKFDHDYYARTHMPLVMKLLKSSGLIRYEVDTGVGGEMPGSPAPYASIGRLYFNTLEEFQSGLTTHGAEILADVANYTDVPLQIQVSQTASS